jgi:hypothetical protein
MARPTKYNADYHSHDKDMRNDKKIKAVRHKFKHLGYSIYNMMLEVLDDCDHFRQEWDETNIELLAGDFEVETERLTEIIDYCVKVKLFILKDGFLYSNGHINRFKPLLSKRKPHVNCVSDVENPHSIVKDSKVEESKEPSSSKIPTKSESSKKQIAVGTDAVASGQRPPKVEGKKKRERPENPTDLKPVQDYFSEKMQGKWGPARIFQEAQRMFNHYTANGWVQNRGKPIVNWRAAANNWILNELNGLYSTGGTRPAASNPNPSHTTQRPPEEKKLTEGEKMQLSRDFMQDCYTDFCNGKLMFKDSLTHYFNQLVMDGLLIISEDDRARIKKLANDDVPLSKRIAVEEFFTKLKAQGVKLIYQSTTT